MPSVDVETRIAVSRDRVWEAMLDIESFPQFMEHVLETRVISFDGTHRVSSWSALLKGSVLKWVEDERIDSEHRVITFSQVDGDLEVFNGTWSAESDGGGTIVRLAAEFEIGIPLLAEMLNPVAARALRENQEQMLRALEARILAL